MAFRPMTEADLQDVIVTLARLRGWLVAHFRPARTERGWRTPVAADGAGFPDLVLVHPERGRLVVAECKSDRGRVTADQMRWLAAFSAAGVETHIWRPEDLTDPVEDSPIGRVLLGSDPPPLIEITLARLVEFADRAGQDALLLPRTLLASLAELAGYRVTWDARSASLVFSRRAQP
jgi:hypothetical protein